MHGLHHVAQKLTITGVLSVLRSAVLTITPATLRILTDGTREPDESWALMPLGSAKTDNNAIIRYIFTNSPVTNGS